jgi:murein DD-endopeptidase MepM/ murein hydrolase activator NlpD
LSAAAILFIVSCSSSEKKESEAADSLVEVVTEPVHPMGFNPDTLTVKEGKVKNGQFFSTLLTSLGMGNPYALTEASSSVFDVRKFRIGQSYQAYYDGESLKYLVYERDRTSRIVFDCTAPYGAWIYEIPVTYVERYADVTINSSLWNDMVAADVAPELSIILSDIYAWTVDFFGLQKGDRFRVLYQEKRCGDKVISIDTVRYAIFSHNKTDFQAVRFDQKDGGNKWWNDKGESMRKAFLKAPLKFSRVSSGFSYARNHPVTGKVKPHTGVDYAAPTGTPVMTIGDGVVTSVKYEGAGGNTVRIKHNSVYSTAYLHLSKYAKGLKVGQRVKQGEVIGYVGSTGRSTGPHLDFRVWKNGTAINPLTMDSPPSVPIKDANKADFEATIKSYQEQIEKLSVVENARELFNLL